MGVAVAPGAAGGRRNAHVVGRIIDGHAALQWHVLLLLLLRWAVAIAAAGTGTGVAVVGRVGSVGVGATEGFDAPLAQQEGGQH